MISIENYAELIEVLRAKRYRVTPQRAIILEAIGSLSGHVTAEQIFEVVKQYNSYISLATVYRTLDLLQYFGLITESHMGTVISHFALRTPGTHHHITLCALSVNNHWNCRMIISKRWRAASVLSSTLLSMSTMW